MSEETCECVNWCDEDLKHRIVTGHARKCTNSPDYTFCLEQLIDELIFGIEYCAHDCDGINEKLWPAYRKAKAMNGIFVKDID